jgi:Survival protein SurE
MRLTAVTLFLCPLLFAEPSALYRPACTDPSLDILLTNDDGFDRPGIGALHDALTAAGHRVTLAAPSRDYSGSGAALSLFDPITLENKEDGVYAIGATPATTALLASRSQGDYRALGSGGLDALAFSARWRERLSRIGRVSYNGNLSRFCSPKGMTV